MGISGGKSRSESEIQGGTKQELDETQKFGELLKRQEEAAESHPGDRDGEEKMRAEFSDRDQLIEDFQKDQDFALGEIDRLKAELAAKDLQLSKELDAERAKLNQSAADKCDLQKQIARLQQLVEELQRALQELKARRSREAEEALQRQKQDAAAVQQLEHELRDLKAGADRVAQEWNCERTNLEAAARAAQDQAAVLRKTLDDEGRYRAELQEKLRQKQRELADARQGGMERAAPHAAQWRDAVFGTAPQGADAAAGPGGRQGPPTGVEVGGLPAGGVDGVSKGFKIPGERWAGLQMMLGTPQSPRGISGNRAPQREGHGGMAQRGGRGSGRGRGSQTGWGNTDPYNVLDYNFGR